MKVPPGISTILRWIAIAYLIDGQTIGVESIRIQKRDLDLPASFS
jgi:hypothetical protein